MEDRKNSTSLRHCQTICHEIDLPFDVKGPVESFAQFVAAAMVNRVLALGLEFEPSPITHLELARNLL